MKFSVLLPTRNRLELLKYAIETVRRQDYNDWEIIVSDNYSEEDIAGYVQSLHEPRIKYYRTDRFIPVTDNWNNALEKSSGDYVIMLGDDDCLMKGYFRTINLVLEKYQDPDFIYTSAFLYAYPGVMPGFPNGFLHPYDRAYFLKSAKEPFWLGQKDAFKCVKQSMNFKLPFDYNMQFSIVNRKFIKSLEHHGKFFQSPYPDFYAQNVIFFKARRILICPIPLVTIGISPKSFGFYYFNQREKQGIDFLKNMPETRIANQLKHIVLPGTDINTSWLFAMENIVANYGSEMSLRVNYRRYRFLQILHGYREYYVFKRYTSSEFHELWRLMSVWEKLVYGGSLRFGYILTRLTPRNINQKIAQLFMSIIGQPPPHEVKSASIYYQNILEVFEKVDPVAFSENR